MLAITTPNWFVVGNASTVVHGADCNKRHAHRNKTIPNYCTILRNQMLCISPPFCFKCREFSSCGLTDADIPDINACLVLIGRSSIIEMWDMTLSAFLWLLVTLLGVIVYIALSLWRNGVSWFIDTNQGRCQTSPLYLDEDHITLTSCSVLFAAGRDLMQLYIYKFVMFRL